VSARLPILPSAADDPSSLVAPHPLGEVWESGGAVLSVNEQGGRWLLGLQLGEERLTGWLDPTDPDGRAFATAGPFRVGYVRPEDGPSEAMYGFLRQVAARIDQNAGAGTLPMPGLAAGLGLRAPKRVPLDRAHLVANLDRAMEAHGGPVDDVVIIVTNPCDMGCVFCPVGDLKMVGQASPFDHDSEFDELIFQIALNERIGARRLHINGNDPLMHPRLLELVAKGQASGFERIVLQTPGLLLDDEAKVAELAEAGVTDVEMPFYAHDDATFGAVTGVELAFTRADAAVRNLLAAGIVPHLHGMAIDATLPWIQQTFDHVTQELGQPWEVGHYKPHHIDTSRHRWLPSYAAVRAAIERTPDAFPPTPLGFPLCLYPDPPGELVEPLEGRPLNLFHWALPYEELDSALWRPTLDRVFPALCDGCALKPRCPGTYQAHLDRHGDADLKPFDDDPLEW
jgi:hypothetical protein